MTDKELNNKQEKVVGGTEVVATKATNLKTIEDLRLQHDNEIAGLKKEIKQLVDANIDWEDKFKRTEDIVEQKDIEKKALEKAYWRERNKTSSISIDAVDILGGPESEDEGKLVSRKVKDILLKRCAEGRYGDFNCATGTMIG